jgi:hypothetical protein
MVALVALALVIWPAQAMATWGSPQTIFGSHEATGDPFIGTDTAGETFVAVGPEPGFRGQLSGVWVSMRPPGASSTFGPPIPIAPAGGNWLQFEVAADGDAVAAWDHGGFIEVSERRAGGPFSAPRPLGRGNRPELSVGPDGTAIIGWTRHRRIHIALRSPGGEFSHAFLLRRRAALHGVGAGRGGVVAAAWRKLGRRPGDLTVNRWLIGQRPGRAHRIRGTAEGGTEAFELTSDGVAIAINHFNPRPGPPYLTASIQRTNGRFPKPRKISSFSLFNEVAALAIGAQGGAILIWHTLRSKGAIKAALLAPGARRFARRRRISGKGPAQVLTVAMAPGGGAIAAWEALSGGTFLNSAVYSPETGWSLPERLPAVLGPVIARFAVTMQDNGSALAAWREFGSAGTLGGGLFTAVRPP